MSEKPTGVSANKSKKNLPSPGTTDTPAYILSDYYAQPVHAPPAAADTKT
ncbi:hypothetical protein [Candidatus Villigracilis proximus]